MEGHSAAGGDCQWFVQLGEAGVLGVVVGLVLCTIFHRVFGGLKDAMQPGKECQHQGGGGLYILRCSHH